MRSAAPAAPSAPPAPSPEEIARQEEKALAKKFKATRKLLEVTFHVDDNNRLISVFGEKPGTFVGIGKIIFRFEDVDSYQVIRRSTTGTKGHTVGRAIVGSAIGGAAGGALGAATGLETKTNDYIAVDIRLKNGQCHDVTVLDANKATNNDILEAERRLTEIQRFLDSITAQ